MYPAFTSNTDLPRPSEIVDSPSVPLRGTRGARRQVGGRGAAAVPPVSICTPAVAAAFQIRLILIKLTTVAVIATTTTATAVIILRATIAVGSIWVITQPTVAPLSRTGASTDAAKTTNQHDGDDEKHHL